MTRQLPRCHGCYRRPDIDPTPPIILKVEDVGWERVEVDGEWVWSCPRCHPDRPEGLTDLPAGDDTVRYSPDDGRLD